MPKIPSQHMEITTTSGKTYDVHTKYADYVKYDIIRARKQYPAADQSNFLTMAVLAYCALTRTGEINMNEVSVDAFIESLEEFNLITEDEESEEDEAQFHAE